ncbi:MAG: Asp-tRNA(Asn)/Glu-tRNA(Gln) amidotransferase GatCAB subunit A, partial [Clostridia bacterium]|nr:Asp-tRNA(Asn)/Glu-tRNA(Gln) amidotransferase GatCAB subunit A [Clostridia bacterium]
MSILERTITDHIRALRDGEYSASELSEAYFCEIRDTDTVNFCAFLSINNTVTRRQARKADKMLAEGNAPLLCGIPYGLKNNICTKEFPTTAGSAILATYTSPYDATAVSLLKRQGSVLLGTTNMDEFGMGSTTGNSAFGSTKNPLNKRMTPGGSSGGSAAAVAASLAPFALGSDTGGSVRQPAAFCGCVGMCPTYGAVSRYGLIAFASSLDRIGVITKSCRDNAIVLSAIAKKDKKDSTSKGLSLSCK